MASGVSSDALGLYARVTKALSANPSYGSRVAQGKLSGEIALCLLTSRAWTRRTLNQRRILVQMIEVNGAYSLTSAATAEQHGHLLRETRPSRAYDASSASISILLA